MDEATPLTKKDALALGDEISAGYDRLVADIEANRLTQIQIDARMAELELMKEKVRAVVYRITTRH